MINIVPPQTAHASDFNSLSCTAEASGTFTMSGLDCTMEIGTAINGGTTIGDVDIYFDINYVQLAGNYNEYFSLHTIWDTLKNIILINQYDRK